jgi:2-polyprenyl-3-methyl-5-hydroxy-6-metoxy-1,4-benzoquinol methylase
VCGLIYQNPRPTAASFAAIYPADYVPHHADDRASYMPHPEHAQACAFVNRLQPAGTTLLDIGCGAGTMLRAMRHVAPRWRLVGIEPDPQAATAAQSYGLDVQQSRLEDACLEHAAWDVVTLWNVLEHLPDPLDTLRRVRALLAADGLLCLAVPMADSFDAWLFGRYWAGWELPRHFVMFNRATLRAMLAQAGFAIVATECHNGIEYGISESTRWLLAARIRNSALRRAGIAVTYTRPFRLAVRTLMRPVVALRRSTVLSVAARRAMIE